MAERYTPYVEGVELIDEGLGAVTISHDETESVDTRKSKDTSSRARRPTQDGIRSQSSVRSENQRSKVLSWRSDPSASFSDWTIEVATIEDDQITCSSFYHCHSNVLVWGPRKCEVFVKLFQERMQQVPPTTITQIELPPSEAEVFPIFLDFLYCETTLSLSPDQICSIYLLAERFENHMFITAIQNFVENLLDFEQSIEFLSSARRHDQREKIEKLELFTNSKICGYLVRYPADATKVPPELLAHILYRRAQVVKVLKGEDPRKFSGEWEIQRSKLLSFVVAECCYHATTSDTGKHTLTHRTFERLTNAKHLPALASQAALKLLQVDTLLGSEKESTGLRQQVELSSLESRCIKALVEDWRSMLAKNEMPVFTKTLSTLRSHILADILMQVSRQYERKCSGHENSPRHEILENLQFKDVNNVSHAFVRERTMHGSSERIRNSLPSSREWKDGSMSHDAKENYDDLSDDDQSKTPMNRYSVAQERYN